MIYEQTVSTKMRVLVENLKTIENWSILNDSLKKDIISCGDKHNRKTNAKSYMTDWMMASKFKSFNNLLKIIVNKELKKIFNITTTENKKLDIICTDMWGLIYKKNDNCLLHNHFGSNFSFTYYVESNENCSPLIFEEPGYLKIQPETGMLCIFDSNYTHYVPKMESDETRIVISGNLSIKLSENKTYL